MRISENFTLYVGGEAYEASNAEKQDKKPGVSIFAGNLGQSFCEDKIAQRKEMAQKQAMKVVSDAWEGDKAIDEDLEADRVRIDKLRTQIRDAKDRMQEIEEQQKILIEEQGYAPDHPELADLAEEKSALQEEYDNCQQDMKVEIATISAIRLERLKHHPMADAKKQAEAIMEQAEKIEEKREEQEAFIEAQKEKKAAAEELVEEMPMEEMLTLEQVKQDVQKEVQNIVDKMKLVAEDIKGAVVDQSV